MPTVPEFAPEITAPESPELAQASPQAFAHTGATLAQGAGQLSDQMAEFNQRYTEARRLSNAADSMVSLNSALTSAAEQRSLIPDHRQAVASFNADADALQKQQIDPISDPFTKTLVQQEFDRARALHEANVGSASLHLEVGKDVGTLDQQLTQVLPHQYAQATSDAQRQQIIDLARSSIDARIKGGYITGDQGTERLTAFLKRADYADAYRDIDADPAAALEKLENPANYPNMDELSRARMISHAESKSRGQEAGMLGDLRARYEDNLASIEATGEPVSPLSADDIRKAFPDQADGMLAKLALAGNLYRARSSIALTSLADDRALLDKWTPKGAGFEDQEKAQGALQTAMAEKWQAVQKDPAAYVLQASSDIAAKFRAAQQDPKQTAAAVGALNAAYDKMGVPNEMRNVLPAPTAQNLVQSIEANPEQAPATMRAMAQQWGGAWPQVWRDLTTAGKLPPAYQAVASLDNQGDGALLARWLGQASQGKKADDVLGEKNVNNIKNTVRNDPDVQAYLASLSRSGASMSQVSAVADAIDSLAFAKSYFNRDPEAAQNAISSFTGKYEFMPQGGARVPRDKFDDVSTRTAQTLGGLALSKIAVPSVYGQPGMPKPQEFLELLKASPMWINSPRGDALWLMDPYGRLVRDKKGAPVAVPVNAPGAQQ